MADTPTSSFNVLQSEVKTVERGLFNRDYSVLTVVYGPSAGPTPPTPVVPGHGGLPPVL